METDPFDLRRKLTIRITLPENVSLVLRAPDAVPPTPGRYTTLIPSTGASHGRGLFRAELTTLEDARARSYLPGGEFIDTVMIAGAADGSGIRGWLRISGSRTADAPSGALDRDFVFRSIVGSFDARSASTLPLALTVTPDMQERVLRRALDGFVTTASGATNGDGDRDSTGTTDRARAFLEGRWRDAAHVDSIAVNGAGYHTRLRGKHATVVCEISSRDEIIRCRRPPSA